MQIDLSQLFDVFQYISSLSIFSFFFHLIISYFSVLLLRLSLFVIWNIIKELIPLHNILNKYSQNNDSECWAVITGATDGIGLGFAQVLTTIGFDICLISRNQQKLNLTIHNLKSLRPPQFKNRKIMSIEFDFVNMSNQLKFQKMVEQLTKIDIGILVNNVGTSLTKPMESFTYRQIKDIININCLSMAALSSALLPQLKKRSKRSAMINLSSFAGQSAVPYVCLYSSTKAMNTTFTEGLSMENPELDILSVRPMFVESPLSRQKKGFNIPDRRQCAYSCLKQLRWEYQTNGYILHRIFGEIHRLFVPKFLHRIVSKKITYKLMMKYWQKVN